MANERLNMNFKMHNFDEDAENDYSKAGYFVNQMMQQGKERVNALGNLRTNLLQLENNAEKRAENSANKRFFESLQGKDNKIDTSEYMDNYVQNNKDLINKMAFNQEELTALKNANDDANKIQNQELKNKILEKEKLQMEFSKAANSLSNTKGYTDMTEREAAEKAFDKAGRYTDRIEKYMQGLGKRELLAQKERQLNAKSITSQKQSLMNDNDKLKLKLAKYLEDSNKDIIKESSKTYNKNKKLKSEVLQPNEVMKLIDTDKTIDDSGRWFSFGVNNSQKSELKNAIDKSKIIDVFNQDKKLSKADKTNLIKNAITRIQLDSNGNSISDPKYGSFGKKVLDEYKKFSLTDDYKNKKEYGNVSNKSNQKFDIQNNAYIKQLRQQIMSNDAQLNNLNYTGSGKIDRQTLTNNVLGNMFTQNKADRFDERIARLRENAVNTKLSKPQKVKQSLGKNPKFNSFTEKVKFIESGGKDGNNPDINKRAYKGQMQIGRSYLEDYNEANKTNYSLEDMKNNELGEKVFNWTMRKNEKALKDNDIPITEATKYLSHQQGAEGITEIFKAMIGKGKLKKVRRDKMLNNLTSKEKEKYKNVNDRALASYFIGRWTKRLRELTK